MSEYTIDPATILMGRLVAGGITLAADGFSITPGFEDDPATLRFMRAMQPDPEERIEYLVDGQILTPDEFHAMLQPGVEVTYQTRRIVTTAWSDWS